jgi:mono/diheme cytochrome c family protein
MSPPTFTPSVKRALGWAAAGAAVATIGFAAVGLIVIEFGLFDATALHPHDPVTNWAAHAAMIHDMRRRAASVRVAPFTASEAQEGFRLYDVHCVACHGAPGVARAGWTSGLTPGPPYLLDAARNWTPSELQVLVGDGVKMTAMPAWRTTLGERQVHSLVAFLLTLPNVSPIDYQRMRAANAGASGGGADAVRVPGPESLPRQELKR